MSACAKLNLPITVIGNGPQHDKLVKMAGPRVSFLTKVKDADMPHYFGRSAAFIFPDVDDFGIVAVEALAAGTPVIAYKDGGALDYVKEDKTGLFFDEPTVDSLAEVLRKFDSGKFNNSQIAKSAVKFSEKSFQKAMSEFINSIGAN